MTTRSRTHRIAAARAIAGHFTLRLPDSAETFRRSGIEAARIGKVFGLEFLGGRRRLPGRPRTAIEDRADVRLLRRVEGLTERLRAAFHDTQARLKSGTFGNGCDDIEADLLRSGCSSVEAQALITARTLPGAVEAVIAKETQSGVRSVAARLSRARKKLRERERPIVG